MWKKQDDAMNTANEFGSKQMAELPATPVSETPKGTSDNSQFEKGSSSFGPQRIPGDFRRASSMPASMVAYPANMAAYTEAVNEFTKNATAFIEHLSLLTKARSAYDQAMKASAEMRKVLDAGDEDLRALMNQLAQAVSKTGSERKRPEMAKSEGSKGTEHDTGAVKAFS